MSNFRDWCMLEVKKSDSLSECELIVSFTKHETFKPDYEDGNGIFLLTQVSLVPSPLTFSLLNSASIGLLRSPGLRLPRRACVCVCVNASVFRSVCVCTCVCFCVSLWVSIYLCLSMPVHVCFCLSQSVSCNFFLSFICLESNISSPLPPYSSSESCLNTSSTYNTFCVLCTPYILCITAQE